MAATKAFWISATGMSLLISMLLIPGCRYTTSPVASKADGRDTTASASQALSMPVDSLAYRDVAQPVREFYARRQGQLFWMSGFHRSARADSLIGFIGKVRYFGLIPDDYHAREINALKGKLNSAEDVYRLEALLTDAYIVMRGHIAFGSRMQPTARMDSAAILSLERYAAGGGLSESITAGEPVFPRYRWLRQGLGQLLDSLTPDERNAVLLDVSVRDALRARIETIALNMERWRSEKQSFGSRYIFINVPAFMLYLVENDSVILESKVIVGAAKTPTPVLSSTIECFVTYPYWNVPRKIAVEEYLPFIQRDTSFIARNNFDVLDKRGNLLTPGSIDWKKFNKNYFPVLLRQREGAENALGVLKFVFDNPYAVYLHDTNAGRLFRSEVRAYSHGCIRMEKAVALAHYLVTGSLTKKSAFVDRFLKEESQHWVELKRPIPIFVRYYTCDADNGRLRYYKDIYHRDAPAGSHVNLPVETTGAAISQD